MSHLLKMQLVIPCTLLAILTGPVSAVAANVGPNDDPPKRVVKFADIDLTRSEGAAVLYSRINAAAREVCQSPDVWAQKLLVQMYECRHQAIAQAIADVDSPKLTEYYDTKTNFGIRNAKPR